MLWEAGPGVCLCISLNPMKRRRACRSCSRAEDAERLCLTTAACQDPKAAPSKEDFITCVFLFIYFLFFWQSISDDKHFIWTEVGENQSNPERPGGCLRVSIACELEIKCGL